MTTPSLASMTSKMTGQTCLLLHGSRSEVRRLARFFPWNIPSSPPPLLTPIHLTRSVICRLHWRACMRRPANANRIARASRVLSSPKYHPVNRSEH